MREGATPLVATPLTDHDFSRHDGILDLQLARFSGEPPALRPIADLHAGPAPRMERRRYHCVGLRLSKFLVKGDIPKLVDTARSGNIDCMRTDFAANAEILVLLLFGGMIEAEASTFTLAETKS